MSQASTIYVCSKCHRHVNFDADDAGNWLIAPAAGRSRTSGELVIRCPNCVTRYAVRKAGGQLQDRGTTGYVGGQAFDVWPGR